MDYMMPKMNGMEATKKIREMGYTYPIVALTANAVAGSSEMFMDNGFDGFISKPIDIRELNIQLNRFIRDKQPPEVIESARRQTAKILSDSVKKPLANAELAATVVRSIESAINVLENICQEIISSSDTDVGLYTITIHGMKGALANIGETDLSNNAQKLEQAGENRDIAVISSETPDFIDALRLLVIKYKPKEKIESAEISNDDMAFLREKLNVIKETCEVYNISETEAALNELKRRTWPRMISGFLDDVAENLLCGKVKEIIAAVDNFIKTTNEELQGESD